MAFVYCLGTISGCVSVFTVPFSRRKGHVKLTIKGWKMPLGLHEASMASAMHFDLPRRPWPQYRELQADPHQRFQSVSFLIQMQKKTWKPIIVRPLTVSTGCTNTRYSTYWGLLLSPQHFVYERSVGSMWSLDPSDPSRLWSPHNVTPVDSEGPWEKGPWYPSPIPNHP